MFVLQTSFNTPRMLLTKSSSNIGHQNIRNHVTAYMSDLVGKSSAKYDYFKVCSAALKKMNLFFLIDFLCKPLPPLSRSFISDRHQSTNIDRNINTKFHFNLTMVSSEQVSNQNMFENITTLYGGYLSGIPVPCLM